MSEEEDKDDNNNKSKTEKKGELPFGLCVTNLLNLQKPTQDGDRVMVIVAGTCTIHYMLQFYPQIAKYTVLRGIFSGLATDKLGLLAKDALGSCCIVDGILGNPNVSNPIFVKAAKQLLTNLQSRWTTLSVHHVGHHTVKKIFCVLPDIKDKEA
jgi:hypothetical protein